MSGFGENLRAERLVRGITLEQISRATNIGVRFLEAIEHEEFHLLPGGVFNVSFVRQYAGAVGLDREETVEAFQKVCPPFELKLEEHFGVEAATNTRQLVAARLAEEFTDFCRRNRGLLSTVGVACLLFTVGLTLYAIWPDSLGSSSAEAPELAAGVENSSAETLAATAAVEETRVERVRVGIEIIDTVWIRAVADGRRVFERTLRAGDQRNIAASESVRLLVGNAGGVAIALNGIVQPPIGERGQVRRVVLTPSGMEIVAPPCPPAAEVAAATAWPVLSQVPAAAARAIFTRIQD